MLAQTLGSDQWANDCRMKVREGMRSKNCVDYGGLKVYRVYEAIILSDGAFVEHPICYANEAQAVIAFTRITTGLDAGRTIAELLPGAGLPAEIINAWVR